MSLSVQPFTAMLFDSNHDHARLVRSLLERQHVRLVEWATTGTGWIAAWQRAKPSFVIVDLLLPKRDGLHCLQKMLSLDGQCVIIFTHPYMGLLANDVELKALAAGATSVLQKPFSEGRFNVSVNRALQYVKLNRKLRKVKVGGEE